MPRPATLALGVLALCLPGLARADALLDRYRDASIARAAIMTDFFVSRVPELAEVMPEIGWDDEIAVISQCLLDGIRAEQGEAGAEAYVAGMEEWATMPIASFATMNDGAPAAVADPSLLQIQMDCGALTFSQERMESSGMMGVLMQPGVMERLMAE